MNFPDGSVPDVDVQIQTMTKYKKSIITMTKKTHNLTLKRTLVTDEFLNSVALSTKKIYYAMKIMVTSS